MSSQVSILAQILPNLLWFIMNQLGMTGYRKTYRSLGRDYELPISNPSLVVITGRGSHSTTNRRGALACVTHAIIRLLYGVVTKPYNGRQDLPIFSISAVGMKLLEAISAVQFNGNVSKTCKV